MNLAVTVTTSAVITIVPRGALSNMGKITVQNTGANPAYLSDESLDATALAAQGLLIAASGIAEYIGIEGDKVAKGLYAIATGGSTTLRVQY